MYNQDLPRRADLPTSKQLRRSTFLAAAVAGVLLVTVVLPAEYGIDPTGAGRMLGLTEMGEIKMQLAREAEADAASTEAPQTATAPVEPVPATEPNADRQAIEQRLSAMEALLADLNEQQEAESAQEGTPVVEATPAAPVPQAEPEQAGQTDEISITLAPGQGAEVKLVMEAGAQATYRWSTDRGVVNCDVHGDGGGRSITYEKVRGEPVYEGTIEAAFTGNHGWFWRNRTDAPLTVTLQTSGDYVEMKRLI